MTDKQIANVYSPVEKYFLTLLYAPDSKDKTAAPIRGNLWLHKEMFLLSRNLDELKDLDFDENRFGPYSPTVQAVQSQYINSNIIKQPYEQGNITLTERGLPIVQEIWVSLTKYVKDIIIEVKQLLNDVDAWGVISLIYAFYPEMTKNSEIIEQYNTKRTDSAISLFKKRKVSLRKAAMVAGKPVTDFIKILKERNIPTFADEEAHEVMQNDRVLLLLKHRDPQRISVGESGISQTTKIPVPPSLSDLFVDLINEKGEAVYFLFDSICTSLMRLNGFRIENELERLDVLNILFGLGKRLYQTNTLNYEIYDRIQNRVMTLIDLVKKRDLKGAESLSLETRKTLQTLMKSKKKLKDAGAENIIIEDTGQRIGEMRVFQARD